MSSKISSRHSVVEDSGPSLSPSISKSRSVDSQKKKKLMDKAIMMGDIENCYCFVEDKSEIYKVGIVETRETDSNITIRILSDNTKVKASRSDIILTHEDEIFNAPEDLIELSQIHPANILYALKIRFEKDLIYTNIGSILLAMNPYMKIPGLYDDDKKQAYNNPDFDKEKSHIFQVTRTAYENLREGMNQVLVISGESGAGKTETTKLAMEFLTTSANGQSSTESLKILQCNPILEAFGNAKTLKNNNSSRYGKFIEINMTLSYQVSGLSNTTYLLEKSRVVHQGVGERNFHIFYQLLNSKDTALLKLLQLDKFENDIESVKYLNQSGCNIIDGIDDCEEFKLTRKALKDVGFTKEEITYSMEILAAILLIGNVNYEESTSSSRVNITPPGVNSLSKAMMLLGIDMTMMQQVLLFKTVRSARRASFAQVPYTLEQALENRDAFAKDLYCRLFDWIVEKINIFLIPKADSAKLNRTIGILDIFGFEIFENNSLEQLLINFANEALQKNFNKTIFQRELDLYASEEVPMSELTYRSNQNILGK